MVINVGLIKKDASQNMAELGMGDITHSSQVSTTITFYHSKCRPYVYNVIMRVCELMLVGIVSCQK